MAKWTIRNVSAKLDLMVKQLQISKVFATVLANRNILTKRALQSYINPDEAFFHNCLDMKDMQNSFNIIIENINKKNKICVYGDYDVDGVTSTVILYKGLKKLGANIIYYIPDREEEGYGLNKDAINEVKNMGVSLILTCDNGIASIDEIDYIKNLNMDIVVLDHHEPRYIELENGEKQDIIPNANAIVNPKQKACNYPFKALCAAGISYKFIKGLYEYMQIDENFDEYLVFASIGTICDIVDLLDENRIIAKLGIEILNNNKSINKGLYEMIKLNNLEEKQIDEYDYGFKLGPCINASGRLESALKSVELFTSEDDEKIKILANQLILLNDERKDLTSSAVEKILHIIENSQYINDKVLVIYCPELNESIAGIVAGRVKEIYYKPTFLITNAKDGAKGSGRSIPSYNMFEEMLKCKDIFTKFGGHKMAAGLSLPKENIDKFRQTINRNCILAEEDMEEIISIDKALNFSEINFDLINELNSMKPIGKENNRAIFATKNLFIHNLRFVGKENNILQFTFKDSSGQILNAISFDGFNKFLKILNQNFSNDDVQKIISGVKKCVELKLDIVYSIDVNQFNGYKNIQLIIKDFRLS